MRSFSKVGVAVATLAACAVWHQAPARACGGCFHEQNPNETPTVITDHRMAFSVSQTQTILWDQVRYSGDPAEFAWVLPVRAGTVVELARDEFLTALENATAPTIAPPQVTCYYPPGSAGGGGGFGCGASSNTADFGGTAPTSARDAGAGISKDAGVQVVSDNVVGPYEAVILRASQGQAITDWLQQHNFAIPSSITPVLDYYNNLKFDFVAVRLRPNQGVRAMQPLRVVSPGADGTLPLRMVAAGVGQSVGIELFVISEGRYQATTFDNAVIDPANVKWDGNAQRSNYTTLFAQTTDGDPKGVWVTEYAGKGAVPVAENVYQNACQIAPPVDVPCDVPDAGTPDAGSPDAGDDGGVLDAGGPPDAGNCTVTVPACDVFDDFDRATAGMNPSDITITRLRTNLPVTALGTDLVVGAEPTQAVVSNQIQTKDFTDPSYNPCPGGQTTPYAPGSTPGAKSGDGCDTSGTRGSLGVSVIGLLGLALAGAIRRRRR